MIDSFRQADGVDGVDGEMAGGVIDTTEHYGVCGLKYGSAEGWSQETTFEIP